MRCVGRQEKALVDTITTNFELLSFTCDDEGQMSVVMAESPLSAKSIAKPHAIVYLPHQLENKVAAVLHSLLSKAGLIDYLILRKVPAVIMRRLTISQPLHVNHLIFRDQTRSADIKHFFRNCDMRVLEYVSFYCGTRSFSSHILSETLITSVSCLDINYQNQTRTAETVADKWIEYDVTLGTQLQFGSSFHLIVRNFRQRFASRLVEERTGNVVRIHTNNKDKDIVLTWARADRGMRKECYLMKIIPSQLGTHELKTHWKAGVPTVRVVY